jgi:osmotically inducible lipoprotein OsmB
MLKRSMTLLVAGFMALAVGACTTPGERAVGGALIGGATGAAVGAAVDGGEGALVGGALGAGAGAIIGAGTAPSTAGCPAGYYLARDGYCYPR